MGLIMKAIAVIPGKKDSAHLVEMNKPAISDVPDGRGLVVEVDLVAAGVQDALQQRIPVVPAWVIANGGAGEAFGLGQIEISGHTADTAANFAATGDD